MNTASARVVIEADEATFDGVASRTPGPGLEPNGSAAGEAWVPTDACTLPTSDQPLRVAEFDTLFATALRAVERTEPTWLRLRLDPRVRTETQSLVHRESECCAFFDFRPSIVAGNLVLDVGVPSGRVDVLDGLEARAEAALRRTDAGS